MRERPEVVALEMVDDHVVDLRRVDDLRHPREQLATERLFHRVHERDLLVHDEIRIISRPLRRGIAMEVPDLPVDGAHPVQALADFDHDKNSCQCNLFCTAIDNYLL
jgi:hypothetical protein